MTDVPTLHDLAVMSNDLAATALGLQQVAVWAIIIFGSVQFLLAVVALVWAFFRDRSSARRHEETMDALSKRHDETMTALSGRRDDAERQHKETMERLQGNAYEETQPITQEEARERRQEGFKDVMIPPAPLEESGH